MTDRNRSWSDDEALSTLLDGELPADEAAGLRERLAREPALAERLEQLARTDAELRNAYTDIVDEPLPPSVLELLQLSQHDGGEVVELRRRRGASPRWFSMPAALAAGIALIVGVFVGRFAGPDREVTPSTDLVADAGSIEPGSSLHAVLESVPSAETRELGASLAATPRLTFRTQNGSWCRQVDVTGATGTSEALACRRGGEWWLEVASFARGARDSGVYRPAAGASTPVRAAVDSMIADEPLDADAERALIANDWSWK